MSFDTLRALQRKPIDFEMKRGRPLEAVPSERKWKGERLTTPNNMLQKLMEEFPWDTGLLTATGKSKLEEREGLKLFEEMSRDPQIKSAITLKSAAIVNSEWEITPGDDSKEAAKIADFVRWNFQTLLGKKCHGLKNIIRPAYLYGRSVSEIIFEHVDTGEFAGNYYIKQLKPKNPGMISFEQDEYNNILNIICTNWIIGDTTRSNPVKVSPYKVVHYAWNTDLENPYGSSDLASCYPWWWAKKTYYKQGLVYGDKFASPIPEFNVEKRLTAEEQKMLEKAGKEFHQASSFVTPKGVETKLHQSNGTGGVFYINAIAQLCNAEIARSILAQTLATNESSKTGTFSQAQVHQETLGEIVGELRGDAEKTIVQDQLIKRLVDINYGPQSVYPQFSLDPFSASELKELAEAFEKLCGTKDINDNALVEVQEQWVRRRLNLPDRDLKELPYRTKPLVDPNKPPAGAIGAKPAAKPSGSK